MTSITGTICWGLAIGVCLSLPDASLAIGVQGQQVPAPVPQLTLSKLGQPAKLLAPPKPVVIPPYQVSWTSRVDAEGSLSLLLTPSVLIVTGVDAPTQAHALDDGHVLWTTPSGADAPPILSGAHIIMTSGAELAALDLATGERLWSHALPGPTLGPTAYNDVVFVAAGSTLSAYRAADGSLVWTAPTGVAAGTSVAVSATATVVGLTDGTLAAFAPGTGQPLWRVPLPVTPTGIVADVDHVYFGTKENFACAYQLVNGRISWCYPVRVAPLGQPSVDATHVYWAFLDNTVRVFDHNNGARRHSVALNARPLDGPQLGGTQLIVPLVTGEFVFFTPGDTFTPTRFEGPDSKVAPPLMQAAAIASDGKTLAMLTVSPSARSIVLFTRTPAPLATSPSSSPSAMKTPPATKKK